jgi:acyl CoA:acetate/3-ketoacid CoA transferase alpha subunit
LCGIPERLFESIQASGAKNLTFASNNAGIDNEGIGKLVRTKQMIAYISAKTRSSSGDIFPASWRLNSARNRLVLGAPYDKKIGRRTVRKREAA